MSNYLRRVANDFLSNGVIGKFNQYCGVKCFTVDEKPYLLEGDQADGYRLFTISQKVIESAGSELCEASFNGYIETVAINEFYKIDGSGYLSDHTENFAKINKIELIDMVKEICKKKYNKDLAIY